MEIKIKETGELVSLTLMYPGTQVDYIGDFIGNEDGLGNKDYQIKYDRCNDTHSANQDTVDWWINVIQDQNKLNDRIFELEELHGYEEVRKVREDGDCIGTELDSYAARNNQVLDDHYGPA